MLPDACWTLEWRQAFLYSDGSVEWLGGPADPRLRRATGHCRRRPDAMDEQEQMTNIPQNSHAAPTATPQERQRRTRICLLGASFDTGNLGVNALAESSIKCILARWPNAEVVLLGSSRQPGEHHLELNGKDVVLAKAPIRFSKQVWLPHHFLRLAFCSMLLRLLPFNFVRKLLVRPGSPMDVLLGATAFIDISGGDSFSDIYGMRRFSLAFLTRLLPLMLRKDLILFPQTYGPFKRRTARWMARYILNRSRSIYSRDHEGLAYVRDFLKDVETEGRIRFAPDVAFLLDPRRPPEWDLGGLEQARTSGSTLIGLNVSGLTYYGGYTGRNEFGLKADYKSLVDRLVRHLLEADDALVVLVPHVIPAGDPGTHVDNDLHACQDVYERLSKEFPGRLFIARGPYDHCQAKYVIGMCDFFIGTRMHSCIAALSQCIPAVGLAYSKKFKGVFQTAGVERLVVDLREAGQADVLAAVDEVIKARSTWVAHLREAIPSVKQQVLDILENVAS
jgi:colanic acid/amylovoran biosynthesis protein